MKVEQPTTCPHCEKSVGAHFEVHEVLVHPEMRAKYYPAEYIEWKASLKKPKKKKRD